MNKPQQMMPNVFGHITGKLDVFCVQNASTTIRSTDGPRHGVQLLEPHRVQRPLPQGRPARRLLPRRQGKRARYKDGLKSGPEVW